MLINISQRARETPPSPIRKLVPFSQAAKAKGVKIYHLNIGQPDIKSPENFLEALKGFPKNIIAYENSLGNPNLIKALCGYFIKHNIKLKPENLIITTGASEAIIFALLSVCDSGDNCLIFEPFYANYLSFATMSNVKLKAIETTSSNGFHLPHTEIITNKINQRTKAIIICNPNNPTGTVYNQNELNEIAKIAEKHNLFIISDETYREFVYDNCLHYSFLSLGNNLKNIILIDSFSKRYSLCGARLGCLATYNTNVLNGVTKFAQARLAAPTIEQFAALEALKTPKSYLKKINKEFQNRRDVLYDGLKTIKGITLTKPEGAFYMTVTLPVKDAEHFSKWLLTDFRYQNQTVMLAPASGFYLSQNSGKNQVRIAYVLNKKDLQQSVIILKKALESYPKK